MPRGLVLGSACCELPSWVPLSRMRVTRLSAQPVIRGSSKRGYSLL